MDAILNLLDSFNFDRVEKVMIATDWKWARHDGLRIPTQDEMKSLALNLLISAECEGREMSSGGFVAKCDQFDDGEKFFKLQFVAAWSWERF